MKDTKQYTRIKTNLQAQLNGTPVLPICLFGAPGLGKSSVISQAAKDLSVAENVISISSTNFETYSG
jgi:predicted AAA+ superfamily ATPase